MIGTIINAISNAWNTWRVERRLKRVDADCKWVERYLRASRLPRANRRRLIKSFGTLALRLAIAQDQRSAAQAIKASTKK